MRFKIKCYKQTGEDIANINILILLKCFENKCDNFVFSESVKNFCNINIRVCLTCLGYETN